MKSYAEHVRSLFSKAQGDSFPPPPDDDFWFDEYPDDPRDAGHRSKQTHVNEDTVLQLSTAYACIRVLVDTLASTPFYPVKITFEGTGGRKRRVVRPNYDHPLYHVLAVQPNDYQTPYEWKERMMLGVAVRGEAYSLIVPGERGPITRLIPLDYSGMRLIELGDDYRLKYTYDDGKKERVYDQSQILHWRGLSLDGIRGLNPVAYHRTTLGMSKALGDHGKSFFENNATPPFVIEIPGKVGKGWVRKFRQTWAIKHEGPKNVNKPAVFEGGLKLHEMAMSNDDAQFLETHTHSDYDVCRIFRVTPHMVALLDQATGLTIENLSIEFFQYSMFPWFTRFQERTRFSLVFEEDTALEFDYKAMLRGDIDTRYKAHATGIQNGFESPNDAREEEGKPPYEGGDEYTKANAGTPNTTGGPANNRQDQNNKLNKGEKAPNARMNGVNHVS